MTDIFSDPALARLYAWENHAFDADLAFYTRFLGRARARVLDVGAGTGRLAIALARRGHTVTALESSRVMLDIARENVAAEPAAVRRRVTCVRGSILTLREARAHHAVVCAFNTLLHIVVAGDQLRALRAMCASLAPRGRLLLDVGSPYAEILNPSQSTPRHVYTIPTEDGGHITLWDVRRADLLRQRTTTDLTYDVVDARGAVTRLSGRYEQRWIYRTELELMLERAGFGDIAVYGDHACTREPVDPLDPLLVLATRGRSRILSASRPESRRRRSTA